MKLNSSRLRIGATVLVSLLAGVAAMSCSDDEGGGDKKEAPAPKPGPGELCFDPDPSLIKLGANPPSLVLAPGQTRSLEIVVDPDICDIRHLEFSSTNQDIVKAPKKQRVDLLNPKTKLEISASKIGSTEIKASFPRGDGSFAELSVPVEVQSADIEACSGSGEGKVDDGGTVKGSGGLALASIGFQKGATTENYASMLWSVSPFDATISCAADQIPEGFTKIGPAVTFGPTNKKFPREIPFSIPVNPAAMPELARMRHVTVSYTGPNARTPRAIPIADPYIEKDGDGYKLSFLAPWLGTYQAIVKSDVGAVRKRRITHRAIIGVSMGGGGAAMAGFRNHQLFDVLAPLGGPVEWTWLLNHIRHNHIGGFHPNDGESIPTGFPEFHHGALPYEHGSSFNRWWYEYPRNGNGGRFPRSEYVQIFRDLALMFGTPVGYNSAPNGENLPAGVPPDDPSVIGNRSNRECASWIDPLNDHPDVDHHRALESECPKERCENPLTLQNYFDKDFNPNGTWPVITFCDGSPQNEALSPYANTWSDSDNNKPMELALAVDYNGNGVRDENEPVIFQGYERFDDVGTDGLASKDEPGYEAGVNEDPNGDDWHPQYNPTGTEGNGRYDEGEPYDDFGLDGVEGTASSPYDFGEGNGKFDYAPGYKTFLERDSRTVISQHPMGTQKEKFTDEAMSRLDLWTDGGTRDLFNFAVSAQAMIGDWAGRDRVVQYFTGFDKLPGQRRGEESSFVAGRLLWEDLPSGVMMRYGAVDPTPQQIQNGYGQHVGTADQMVRRLQSALYYIGSRWPDANRTQSESSQMDPVDGASYCEVQGSCDFEFTDTRGRTGPVSVNLPPGYANKAAQGRRYPVIYMLHGYGQTPDDLKAAIIFLTNWMNSPVDSSTRRLPEAILVYVDGRCRPNEKGEESECIRGTFFTDSVREKGPKIESWWMELVQEVDKRYRTMPETEIDWVE